MRILSEEEKENRTAIAWRIEFTRVLTGMTIAELSIQSGISTKSIEVMRRPYDKRLSIPFTEERLNALGSALKVSPLWLKTGLAKDLDTQTAKTLRLQNLLGVEK